MLMGCSNGISTEDYNNIVAERDNLKTKYETLKKEKLEIEEKYNALLSQQSQKEEDSNNNNTELKEPLSIKTEKGEFLITILGVDKTDWYKRTYGNNDKTVIMLNYEIENIDYKATEKVGIYLSQNNTKVLDDNNYILDTFNTWYDGYSFPSVVSPGEKAKNSMAYVIENNTKFVTMKIFDETEIKIDIN